MPAFTVRDRSKTLLGLSFDQWSTLAGQMPKIYPLTCKGAMDMRLDWLRAEKALDPSKKDDAFAAALFRQVAREKVA